MEFDEILAVFGAKKSGKEFKARCTAPEHPDASPSLSITMGTQRDCAVLICRSRGCSVDDICAGAGITTADLFFSTNGTQAKVVARYDYRDERGKILCRKCRTDPKGFFWERLEGAKWIRGLRDGARRVPYNLPEICRANFALICEGEKDCDAGNQLRFTTTNSKDWQPEWSELFRGKQVAIIEDRDKPGKETASIVAHSVYGKAAQLKVFSLPGAHDLFDWVQMGGTQDALEVFIKNQPEWVPDDFFDSYDFLINAPPLRFGIENFLQLDCATIIAGLSGHAKTFFMLAMVKARLEGGRLFATFKVNELADRIVYLIPESGLGPFAHRLKLFSLMEHVKSGRLLVRTLAKGPAPQLDDPRILRACRDADVYLDTAPRFMDGDENSSGDNARGFGADIFNLQTEGAKAIIAAQHCPKDFEKHNYMTLENMVRGSGDIGACFATGWGLRQVNKVENIIYIKNVKARDFEEPLPFMLIGRPHINQTGNFKLHKAQGEAGELSDHLEQRNKGGAPQSQRDARAANKELLRTWILGNIAEDRYEDSDQLSARFAKINLKVSPGTVRRYKSELAL